MKIYRPPQERMIITDGRIKMADGSSLRAYLKTSQSILNLSDGDFVNVIGNELCAEIIDEATMNQGRVA